MREDEHLSRRRARQLRGRMNDAEIILWSRLRRHPKLKFRRQHPIGAYIADFACVSARLVVEADGDSHEGRMEHDRIRDLFMQRRGWRVLRVLNLDIYRHLNEVIDSIDAIAEGRSK